MAQSDWRAHGSGAFDRPWCGGCLFGAQAHLSRLPAQRGARQDAFHPARRFASADQRPHETAQGPFHAARAAGQPVRHPGKAHARRTCRDPGHFPQAGRVGGGSGTLDHARNGVITRRKKATRMRRTKLALLAAALCAAPALAQPPATDLPKFPTPPPPVSAENSIIGPDYTIAPEASANPNVPQGDVREFILYSEDSP